MLWLPLCQPECHVRSTPRPCRPPPEAIAFRNGRSAFLEPDGGLRSPMELRRPHSRTRRAAIRLHAAAKDRRKPHPETLSGWPDPAPRRTPNRPDALPLLRGHARASACLISRKSHTRAEAQERSTVAGEMDRTWAVCSVERPPKNRNSTMRACRASSRARSLSASSRAMSSTSRVGSFMTSSSASLYPPSRLRARCLRA
jgi:hypothetical protein